MTGTGPDGAADGGAVTFRQALISSPRVVDFFTKGKA
jgi:hypothetical protein